MRKEMKDSGIPWIGEIPSHWETDNIGSLYSQRNEKVSDKDYPPLSVSKMGVVPQLETAAKTDDGDNRKLVRKGDFAINSRSDRRGSCGISAYDGSVSLINTILTPRTEMNPRFYDWLFHTSVFADEFYKWGHGIVDDLWTTRWAEMKRISIVVPPIHEQQSIADFLDKKCGEIDEMVSLQEKIVEELKAYKQSVITEAVCKGLNPDVPMKDSGIEWIGQIPEGWRIVRIKNILQDIGDITKTGEEEPLSVTQNRGIIKSSEIEVANPSLSTVGWKVVRENDIVFNKYKAHSGVFFVSPYNGIVTFNYSVYRCIFGDNPKYYEYLFKTIGCIGEFRKEMRGVGESISPLYTKDLFTIRVQAPPVAEQKAIVDYLDSKCSEIDALISLKQSKIDTLKEYKKSIIYEYITGKNEING